MKTMKFRVFVMTLVLIMATTAVSPTLVFAKSKGLVYTDEDYARLKAVINHVENVLHYGHSYNPDTKLLPDGINTLTGEPAYWEFPNRSKVPFSNLANQQNFLRTLVALSKVTGSDKYEKEAKEILTEFIDNYQNPNGLFYWGGHRTINLDTLEVVSTENPNGPHELKNMMPYYELMLQVNEEATIKFMKQLWTAHYYFNSGDLNRHGSYGTAFDPTVFGQEIGEDIIKFDEKGNPILPADSPGLLPFVNSATDLSYAAFWLYDVTDDPAPKNWAEYLMRQYNLASNPVTGMTVYQFKSTSVTKGSECLDPIYTNSGCGDRAARQFRDFGEIAREANAAWKNTQAVYVDNVLMLLEVADKFGIDYYVDWARQYIESYLKYVYIRINGKNKIIPMWNDGTIVYGYVTPETGYFGDAGMMLDFVDMPTTYLLPIVRTIIQLKKDEDKVQLWTYLREIMDTYGLGDIGSLGGKNPSLNNTTHIDDPYALMTMVELYKYTGNEAYLDMARKIGDNIVKLKFRRGFFVQAENLLYSRLDQPETLALLILDGVIRGYELDELPFYLADSGYIHGYMLAEDGVTEDRNYSQHTIFKRTIYQYGG